MGKEAFLRQQEEIDRNMHLGLNFDTVKKEFLYGGIRPAVYYYINGFGNGELIERMLSYMIGNREGVLALSESREKFLCTVLPFAEVSEKKNLTEALREVYSGASMFIVDGFDGYIIADTKKIPSRSVEEPQKDKVLRGPRDGFVEAILPNSALIRRRIRDKRLIFQKITVGSETSTDILVCHMEGIADEGYVKKLCKEISSLKVAGLSMGQESLSELLIKKKWYNPFPKVRYTERPDAAAAMLLEGSVIVLCDNYPSAMILPTSIFDFLQDTDDFYFTPIIGGYMKLVRNGVYFVSLLLTPVFYTLQTMPQYVPESLSFFLYNGESFLPLFWQLFFVELAIDGLKLASLNTPDTLSNSLSVISALILGDIAIEVGWLSPQVLLYMSFVAIANFTQPSYELGYAFKFMRIITLILIALFSYVGLILGILLTILAIITNNSVSGGKGYLYPLIPFNGRALARLFFRAKLTEKSGGGPRKENSQMEN